MKKAFWFLGLLIILSSAIFAKGNLVSTTGWPAIIDLDVRNFEFSVTALKLDEMNASLAANNFQPFSRFTWGFNYSNYMKTAPHTNFNIGAYSNQLFTSSQKGVKKAAFNLQSFGLQANRDIALGNISISPVLGGGFSIANLSLKHIESDDIYVEPREVAAQGFYVSGIAGLNLNYNINEIIALTAAGRFIGGYKLFAPIKSLDSYTGLQLGLGIVITLPLSK
jgi:hypothetical protein